MGYLPEPIEAILLDAGGVLLDLDYGYVRRLIETTDQRITEDGLSRLEAIARKEINSQVRDGARVGELWRDYFHMILGRAGVPVERQEELINTLWDAHQRFGLWTLAIDGGPETVDELKRRGYRIGVVSNAEGRVAQDLDSAGYKGLLETVVDSHVVGVEKPDPGIFEIAMDRLGVNRNHTIYLGDVPSVDVKGARLAGLTPILLDRHDLYADADVPRLRSIRQLPDYLDAARADDA